MKKVCSIVLLLAMLLSLAVVGTFGTSADSTLTATKATVKPVIDGVIDPIWETATAITYIGANAKADAYVKILWDETNLYILAVCPGTDPFRFIVCDRKWTTSDATTSWEPRARGLKITNDGTTDKANWFPPDLPASQELKVVSNETGYIVELSIPKVQSANYTKDQSISFAGALGDNNRTQNVEWDWEKGYDYADGYAEVKLIDNPGLPQATGKTVVMHGVQTTAVTDGKFDARFVAEIASLDYDKAGFEVQFSYNGTDVAKQLDTTVAYTSVLANGSTLTATKEGNYLVAVVLKGIPEDAALTITVKPYTVSGETVSYGNSGTVQLSPTVSQSN